MRVWDVGIGARLIFVAVEKEHEISRVKPTYPWVSLLNWGGNRNVVDGCFFACPNF